MMNLFKLSEQLKDFSKDQLVQEMKMPSGSVPQYLILSELQRRTRMEQAADGMTGPEPTTVAEDAVAAAGLPQAGLAGMARAMAPQTDMTENSGIAAMAPQGAPVERMQEGGEVEGPYTSRLRDLTELQRALEEARVQTEENLQRILRAGRDEEPGVRQVEPSLDTSRLRDAQRMMEVNQTPGVGLPFVDAALFADADADVFARPENRAVRAELATRELGNVGPVQGPPMPPGEEPSIGDVAPRVSDVEVGPGPMTATEELAEIQRRGDRPFPMLSDTPDIFEAPEFRAPSRPGPVQGPNLPREPVDPGEFSGLPDYMTDPTAPPPEDIRNPLRVLFGDDAIDAIPRRARPEPEPLPQDTGTPLVDQDVEDLLPPPREAEPSEAGPGGPGAPGGAGGGSDLDRLYEQDRWLALARFGLGLMGSREPTLGGAIGEAGQSALDYMAGARESMMDRRMQEAELDLARQRLALSAAGGDAGPNINQLIQRLQDQQEYLGGQLGLAQTPEQELQIQMQLRAIQQQLGGLLGLPTPEPAAPVDARPGFFERMFG